MVSAAATRCWSRRCSPTTRAPGERPGVRRHRARWSATSTAQRDGRTGRARAGLRTCSPASRCSRIRRSPECSAPPLSVPAYTACQTIHDFAPTDRSMAGSPSSPAAAARSAHGHRAAAGPAGRALRAAAQRARRRCRRRAGRLAAGRAATRAPGRIVTDSAALQAAAARRRPTDGAVHILVNSAGHTRAGARGRPRRAERRADRRDAAASISAAPSPPSAPSCRCCKRQRRRAGRQHLVDRRLHRHRQQPGLRRRQGRRSTWWAMRWRARWRRRCACCRCRPASSTPASCPAAAPTSTPRPPPRMPLSRVGTADDVAAAIQACATTLRYATGTASSSTAAVISDLRAPHDAGPRPSSPAPSPAT